MQIRDNPSAVSRYIILSRMDTPIIDINALSMPTESNEIVLRYPKMELSYVKDKKPSALVRKFIVDGEISGTPIAVFNSLYGGSRQRLTDNILKKKVDTVTYYLGRDTIFVGKVPVFALVNLYDEAQNKKKKLFVGFQLLQLSNPTAKYIIQKLVPSFVFDGYELTITDMSDWKHVENNVIHRINENLSEILLNHIDTICENV